MSRRRIAVVSVSRADRAAADAVSLALRRRGDDVEPMAIAVDDPHDVAGPDLSPGAGLIRLPHLFRADAPAAAAIRAGALTSAFAEAFAQARPDIVVVAGDRYETHAAATAALLAGSVLAHLHGGEITRGALDDPLRHAISKLAHLHFCATPQAARRLVAMGEEPWRITRAGAPALDSLMARPRPDREAFFAALDWSDPGPFALVTYHPVTARPDESLAGLDALLAALVEAGLAAVFTGVNADPGAGPIAARIAGFVASHPNSRAVAGLGELYPAALGHAAVMLGNSSSGLIEAPSFGLPAVNIGARQEGRDRGGNVIDCPAEATAVTAALRRALTPEFRALAAKAPNPYGDGRAAPVIAKRLALEPITDELRIKQFPDPAPGAGR